MQEILKPIILFSPRHATYKYEGGLEEIPTKLTWGNKGFAYWLVSEDYKKELDYFFARIGMREYIYADNERNAFRVDRASGKRTPIGILKSVSRSSWEIV